MSINGPDEMEGMRAAGEVVRMVLDAMKREVRPGVTTAELDAVGEAVMRQEGAQSAPAMVYKFPGANCISVNDEAIHGIPGDRVIRSGDLVKLDLVAEKDGYYADAAVTIRAGQVNPTADALARCAERAFHHALGSARAGNRVHEIGRAVERETRRSGFRVIRELCGHGVGRTIHEPPSVPNYHEPRLRSRLTEGLVITIEPIISAGSGQAALQPDRWTIRTADGSLSAHYEHTVVITKHAPILLTAA